MGIVQHTRMGDEYVYIYNIYIVSKFRWKPWPVINKKGVQHIIVQAMPMPHAASWTFLPNGPMSSEDHDFGIQEEDREFGIRLDLPEPA